MKAMSSPIPFTRPYVSPRGEAYLQESLQSGNHAGDGPFTQRCSRLLESILGAPKALLTPSCTAALEMCALLLDLKPGDEVILPAFTFVSTANAFVLRGAHPVFCDSEPGTGNLDASRLEALFSPRTKAVVVVHYGGVACQMDRITALCRTHGVPLVEDFAHGPIATYKGQSLGTFGALATLSFHHTKNFSCGEGGALIINDPRFLESAEIMREKGTNRSQFMRGMVDKYTWVSKGSSFLLSDLQAALLLGALEDRIEIQASRRRVWDRYQAALGPDSESAGIGLLAPPPDTEHASHLFYVVLKSMEERNDFLDAMKGRGIQCPFHYQSLPETPFGLQFGGQKDACPTARLLSDRLVRLPLWVGLSDEQVETVIREVLAFIRR